MTFLLVWVIFATAVDPGGAFKTIAGLAIGLTITIGVLAIGPLTGRGVEPGARAWPGARVQRLGRLVGLHRRAWTGRGGRGVALQLALSCVLPLTCRWSERPSQACSNRAPATPRPTKGLASAGSIC